MNKYYFKRFIDTLIFILIMGTLFMAADEFLLPIIKNLFEAMD